MKWITRKNANVDRIACPRLIQLETPMYDALYAWCQEQVKKGS
jgi:hypothetical protein